MLKATTLVNHDIDMKSFEKLTAFLKKCYVGHRPNKSRTFTKNEIDKFVSEAPDDKFLLMKVSY